jgi:hypothetical protein
MASSITDKVIISPSIQDRAVEKISSTTIEATRDVIRVLIEARAFRPQDLTEKVIAPRYAAFTDADVRTHQFALKMTNAINGELNKLAGMQEGFAMLANAANDQALQDKLVQAVALPRIRILMQELDKLDVKFIDKIIQPSPPVEAVIVPHIRSKISSIMSCIGALVKSRCCC